MNKIINYFQNAVLTILAIFIIIFLIFFNRLEISDELWNFQNIIKMYNGLQIYKDANVIITPLFFYIGDLLFHIFGANIFIFRIYGVAIYAGILIICYKILKNLKISKFFLGIYTMLIIEFIFSIMTIGANYNMLAELFVLIGLNLYILKKSNNLIQGFWIFLIFFTKQNFGVIYAVTIIIWELYLNKFSKKFVVDQFKKFLFFLIPTLAVLGYMYIDGNLIDFINYAFGGILDFGKNNIVFIAYGYYSFIPIVVVGLYVFVLVKRKTVLREIIDKEKFDNITLLFIFSIGTTGIIYPIMNHAHFSMVMPFYIIFICYLFGILIFENLFSEEKYKENIKWLMIIILFALVLRVIAYMCMEEESEFIFDKNSNFFGAYIHSDILEVSSQMEEYIIEKNSNGIDVIILYPDSAVPMINLGQSHGVYDLLFMGNMGYNGIEKIKEDIMNRKNTEFLIVTNEEDMFWQESKEIRNFIIENLEYSGEINKYTIYSTD